MWLYYDTKDIWRGQGEVDFLILSSHKKPAWKLRTALVPHNITHANSGPVAVEAPLLVPLKIHHAESG